MVSGGSDLKSHPSQIFRKTAMDVVLAVYFRHMIDCDYPPLVDHASYSEMRPN